ncbi:hypothetical protein DKG77_00740 [Flagellimonas aquimarina]|uniref:cysteine-S-conjugate beta-lyase n=1 Tax=Flagellimonas aquimarina TaxID=2201895 RepID=A0A316L207_9FLAO|nr:PatB family C-S lyase [Allomuricauda koreensis]PWL39398.1 hypothetical protein DKG77_00740 [Allomuricauda koreensis]
MKTDKHIEQLPLSKSNPKTLLELFGTANVVPMWIADMDYEIAEVIQEALIQRISNSSFGYEYKPESFILAQKTWYKSEYDVHLDSEHIIYSPSITTTIAIAIESFTKENDGVIIQPPVFMEFRDVVRKAKRKIIKNPLKLVDGHYEIDFEDLENKVKLDTNKVLILCNPHNPVGRVWKKEELERIVNICSENNVLLISDEIHKDIILFNNTFTSLLHYSNQLENLIICTSEAKTFNLASISDSMAIVPNNDLRSRLSKSFQKYNLGATNSLTRVALETAYLHGKPWLKDLLKNIQQNVNTVELELQNTNISMVKPEGTYQIWIDFRTIFKDPNEMSKFIAQNSGIALNAGHWFGREGALFMRMNIATSNKKVANAIKRIKTAIKF